MAEKPAILTIEAASPGGVPTLVDTLYALFEQWGAEPIVYRAQFAEGDLSLPRRVWHTLTHWRAHQTDERGSHTFIVPAPPLPLWGFYWVPQFLIGPLLGKHDVAFVATGSAHVALPLALRSIPYALWVATLYEDELRAKANAGDAWATRVLGSPMWPFLAWQERLALRRAERILALSYHTAERIKAELPDLADKVELLLFPVDTDRFHPDPIVETPHGRYLFLAARINDPRKNVKLLLRAFALIHQQHPDLSLVLSGEPPTEELRHLAEELGISDTVAFAGVVPYETLIELYKGAELFTFPSLQEGLGISAMEALACGTPVVAMTSSGGPEGIVIDGVTGRMVADPHDPQAFADAILTLLDDPDELAVMRERCAAFARDHYAAPVLAEQIRAVYDDLRGRSKPAPQGLELAAAGWGVLIFGAYMVHQMRLLWPSIRDQLVVPLLGL